MRKPKIIVFMIFLTLPMIAPTSALGAVSELTIIGESSFEEEIAPGLYPVGRNGEFYADQMNAYLKEVYYQQPYSRTSNTTYEITSEFDSVTYVPAEQSIYNMYAGNTSYAENVTYVQWLEAQLAATIYSVNSSSLPMYVSTENTTYAEWLETQLAQPLSVWESDSLPEYTTTANSTFLHTLENEYEQALERYYCDSEISESTVTNFTFSEWVESQIWNPSFLLAWNSLGSEPSAEDRVFDQYNTPRDPYSVNSSFSYETSSLGGYSETNELTNGSSRISDPKGVSSSESDAYGYTGEDAYYAVFNDPLNGSMEEKYAGVYTFRYEQPWEMPSDAEDKTEGSYTGDAYVHPRKNEHKNIFYVEYDSGDGDTEQRWGWNVTQQFPSTGIYGVELWLWSDDWSSAGTFIFALTTWDNDFINLTWSNIYLNYATSLNGSTNSDTFATTSPSDGGWYNCSVLLDYDADEISFAAAGESTDLSVTDLTDFGNFDQIELTVTNSCTADYAVDSISYSWDPDYEWRDLAGIENKTYNVLTEGEYNSTWDCSSIPDEFTSYDETFDTLNSYNDHETVLRWNEVSYDSRIHIEDDFDAGSISFFICGEAQPYNSYYDRKGVYVDAWDSNGDVVCTLAFGGNYIYHQDTSGFQSIAATHNYDFTQWHRISLNWSDTGRWIMSINGSIMWDAFGTIQDVAGTEYLNGNDGTDAVQVQIRQYGIDGPAGDFDIYLDAFCVNEEIPENVYWAENTTSTTVGYTAETNLEISSERFSNFTLTYDIQMNTTYVNSYDFEVWNVWKGEWEIVNNTIETDNTGNKTFSPTYPAQYINSTGGVLFNFSIALYLGESVQFRLKVFQFNFTYFEEGGGDSSPGISASYAGREDFRTPHTFTVDVWENGKAIDTVVGWNNQTDSLTTLGSAAGRYYYTVDTATPTWYSVGLNASDADGGWRCLNLTYLLGEREIVHIDVSNTSRYYVAGEFIEWNYESDGINLAIEIISPNESIVLSDTATMFLVNTSNAWDLGWYIVNATLMENASVYPTYFTSSFKLTNPTSANLFTTCPESAEVDSTVQVNATATAGTFPLVDLWVHDNISSTNHSLGVDGGTYDFTYAESQYVQITITAEDTEGYLYSEMYENVFISKREYDLDFDLDAQYQRGETISINASNAPPTAVLEIVSPNGTEFLEITNNYYEFDSNGHPLGDYYVNISLPGNTSCLGASVNQSFRLINPDFPILHTNCLSEVIVGTPWEIEIRVEKGAFNTSEIILFNNQTESVSVINESTTLDVSGNYTYSFTPAVGGYITFNISVIDHDENWVNESIVYFVAQRIAPNLTCEIPSNTIRGNLLEMNVTADIGNPSVSVIAPNGSSVFSIHRPGIHSFSSAGCDPGWYSILISSPSNDTHRGETLLVNYELTLPSLPSVTLSYNTTTYVGDIHTIGVNASAGDFNIAQVDIWANCSEGSNLFTGELISGEWTQDYSNLTSQHYTVSVQITDVQGNSKNITLDNLFFAKICPDFYLLGQTEYKHSEIANLTVVGDVYPTAYIYYPNGSLWESPSGNSSLQVNCSTHGWWRIVLEHSTNSTYLARNCTYRFEVVNPITPSIFPEFTANLEVGVYQNTNCSVLPGTFPIADVWISNTITGANESGTNSSFVSVAGGIYNISYTIRDSAGHWYTSTWAGLVYEKQTPIIQCPGPLTYYLGETLNYTSTGNQTRTLTLYTDTGVLVNSTTDNMYLHLGISYSPGYYTFNVSAASSPGWLGGEASWTLTVNTPNITLEWNEPFQTIIPMGEAFVFNFSAAATRDVTISTVEIWDADRMELWNIGNPAYKEIEFFGRGYNDFGILIEDSAGGQYILNYTNCWVHKREQTLVVEGIENPITAGSQMDIALVTNQTLVKFYLYNASGDVLYDGVHRSWLQLNLSDTAYPGWWRGVFVAASDGQYYASNTTFRFEVLPKKASVSEDAVNADLAVHTSDYEFSGDNGCTALVAGTINWTYSQSDVRTGNSYTINHENGTKALKILRVQFGNLTFEPAGVIVNGEEISNFNLTISKNEGNWAIVAECNSTLAIGGQLIVEAKRSSKFIWITLGVICVVSIPIGYWVVKKDEFAEK